MDGLPHVGAVVYPKQPYYSKVDTVTKGAQLPGRCATDIVQT